MNSELAAIARELYALTPDRFVAERNRRAKEEKGRGAGDLAAGIRALPKPSAAAWAVGLLARERAEHLDQVLALGESLRQAQADLDPAALRSLGAERRRLVAAMAKQAGSLVEEQGHRLGASAVIEVEQTIQAAMADPDAAAAVTSGRLVRSLVAEGLDAADLSGALGGGDLREESPSAGTPDADGSPEAAKEAASGATVSSIDAARAEKLRREEERRARRLRDREEAEARRHAAERREEEAGRVRSAAERRMLEEAERRDRLQSEVDDLRERLARLERALVAAEESRSEAERQIDAAEEDREKARQEAARAQVEVDRLS